MESEQASSASEVGVFRPPLRLLDYNRAHVAPSTFSAIGSLVFLLLAGYYRGDTFCRIQNSPPWLR
jgi:hypothetical protein